MLKIGNFNNWAWLMEFLAKTITAVNKLASKLAKDPWQKLASALKKEPLHKSKYVLENREFLKVVTWTIE